jgi:hypothetical protein
MKFRSVFKIMVAGFFLISTGLQPGDIAGICPSAASAAFNLATKPLKRLFHPLPSITGLKLGANENCNFE